MIDQTPYFTVIVPMYRCERYIVQCLDSLRAQSFINFEAICVDDASPDATAEIAKTAVGGDVRFSFYSLPNNQGQSAARNLALDKARGEVIVLLDADDYLQPTALEKIAERFARQNLDDLYFNAESFYEDAEAHKRAIEDFSQRPDFLGVATGMELFTFFEEKRQWMPHGALRAIRRSLIEDNNIRFYEGIIHEDLLFTLQTLLVSRRSSFLNEPIYRRRIHVGSTMTPERRSMKNIAGHLVSIRYVKSWLNVNADQLEPSFVQAMTFRMNDYLTMCAEDYLDEVPAEEKEAFLAKLSPQERVEFEFEVGQLASVIADRRTSIAYRVGTRIMAIPLSIRDVFRRARRNR